MNRKCFAIGLATLVLVGCGGSGGSGARVTLQPGFYRGTLNIEPVDGLVGSSGTLVADVVANGDFTGFSHEGPQNADIVKSGTNANLMMPGTTLSLTARETGGGSSFGFSLRNSANVVVADGALQLTPLPALGSQTQTPPQGSYAGEVVIESNGKVRGFGQASATIDALGNLQVNLSGVDAWADQLFGGVDPGGAIESGSVMQNGNSIGQTTNPQYSYDGTTLVIRYDNLALEPGSAFVTLTMPVP